MPAAAIVIIVILVQSLIPHFFPAFFTMFARPFWRAKFSLESGSFKSPPELLAENENLKLELDNAEVRLKTIQAVENENAELKSFFGRNDGAISTSTNATSFNFITLQKIMSSSKRNKRVLAPVLVHPPASAYDEFIIDGGSDMSFAVGDKVYASGNVLIGSISDVLAQTSKVTLLSSPGNIINVLIGGLNVPAAGVGRGGGQYFAELPRTAKISAGDFVIAPSVNDKPFGVVSAVISDPARAFETVLFAPAVNLYQLRWVLVAINHG
jgi:cell shape-determining protein MreC